MPADLPLRFVFALLQALQVGDGGIASRYELLLFFGVQRLLFRGHGQFTFVAVELQHGMVAIAALIAQGHLRGAANLTRSLLYLEVKARCGGGRARLAIARKLLRRAYHTLRELGDQALEEVA